MNTKQKPDTLGFAIELKYADQVKVAIKNTDALAAVKLAKQMKAFGIVVAGQLHKQKTGCFFVILPDASLAEFAAIAAHARMGELGSKLTCWMVKFNDEKLQQSVTEALGSGESVSWK